ncbi:MAG TPA: malate synthase A [Thermoanaerobaculia bacterium]|jgi:malate synthase|nr:malate synthase A [Thermoanaerobaculia bacterium]
MTDVVVTTDIEVLAEVRSEWDSILSDEALGFVALLHKEFDERRLELLAAREERKKRLDAGELPDFLPETREIRESDWTVAPIPHDLRDRRVEITGPVDRKMIINALNSGANVFMADFEDANSPTWENCVQGQLNLVDAVRRTISFESGAKQYKLNDRIATLLVRPRGWHLAEAHVTVDGTPVSASLFDFAIYFFHNAKELIARGTGPYFYLPKMESHLEARLWNDVFVRAQQELGVPVGTIRATVLIETILASFEMHEILWELRDHSAGLNCGRWDYIFSFIKKFRARRDFITPDRGSITMDKAFLAAYVDLLIQTCHQRGIHAMGGMAAQIPIKGDDSANEAAFAKVRADKLREVKAGHDGTWVAHPGMVALAKEVFDEHMPSANQIANEGAGGRARGAGELLELPDGVVTEKGVRQNINVGILYLAAWLGGSGAVPLYNLMEDAATAEISRTQLWQWIHHGARLHAENSIEMLIDAELYRRIRDEELTTIGDQPHVHTAAAIFDELILADELADFLTIPAYRELLELER